MVKPVTVWEVQKKIEKFISRRDLTIIDGAIAEFVLKVYSEDMKCRLDNMRKRIEESK